MISAHQLAQIRGLVVGGRITDSSTRPGRRFAWHAQSLARGSLGSNASHGSSSVDRAGQGLPDRRSLAFSESAACLRAAHDGGAAGLLACGHASTC